MTTDYLLRPATGQDADLIINLVNDIYDEYGLLFIPEDDADDILAFEAMYSEPKGAFYVILHNHAIVGAIGTQLCDNKTVHIHHFHLRPQFRGIIGLGDKLLETALAWARDQQIKQVTLWVNSLFEWTHQLYQDAGFTHVHSREVDDINQTIEYQFILSVSRKEIENNNEHNNPRNL